MWLRQLIKVGAGREEGAKLYSDIDGVNCQERDDFIFSQGVVSFGCVAARTFHYHQQLKTSRSVYF